MDIVSNTSQPSRDAEDGFTHDARMLKSQALHKPLTRKSGARRFAVHIRRTSAAITWACAGALTTLCTTANVNAQDTLRIKSTSAPLWGPNVKLTVLKEIGQSDGPDEYSFGSLGAVTFDKQGRLYAYDTQDKKLRAYDADGKFLRNIGATGAGPGEFEDVSSLKITDDSIVVVRDADIGRVSYFYPSGKLRGTFNHPGLTRSLSRSFTIDRDGLATFTNWRTDPALAGKAPTIDRMRYTQLVRVRSNGTAVDSMKIPASLPWDDATTFMIASWGAGNNFVAQSSFAALQSGGFVAGDGDALRFMIRPAKGPVRMVERAWNPVPLGREERANWLEFAAYMKTRPQGVGGTGKPRDFQIPNHKPAFKDIFADEDSRIWISIWAQAHKVELPPRPSSSRSTNPRLVWRQNETYDVFSDKGEYLGRVVMPDGMSVGNSRGNRMWTVGTGPNDEELIRVYTLSGSAALKP